MRVAAVVVAGGRGERFGGLKQFAPLGATTVAARSVALARSVANTVVLVVPATYTGDGEGADVIVIGGATRSASVRSGLAALESPDVVVIHDAARPLASADLFRRVVDALISGAAGAVPGVAVFDTIKRVARDGQVRVIATIPRDDLVTVQTPQAFRFDALVAAHASGAEATDDAALLEGRGDLVIVVEGEPTNFKITDRADLEIASAMVASS